MADLKKIDKNFQNEESTLDLLYLDPKTTSSISLYGLNWFKEDLRYARFPKTQDELIKSLSDGLSVLSFQPSGAHLAFYSNSSVLKIKVKLGTTFNMSHMAFTGQGGFDLYLGSNLSDLTFYKTSSYNIFEKAYEFTFFKDLDEEMRLIVINFPLYAGVEEILIGLDKESIVNPACDLYKKGKIVCYGTSITQGGCASRPGMSYTSILSRRLGYEVLNFGFSGNGRGQKEVAQILSSINDAILFILDYEANATLAMLKDTLDDFISIIRKENPVAPILVISKIKMSVETHFSSFRKEQQKSLSFQKQVVEKYQKTDSHIFFLDGHKLLGRYTKEATVDGCHPTDLGFMMMAENLEKFIKKNIKL